MADRFPAAAASFAPFLPAAGVFPDPGEIAVRLRAGPVPPGMLVDLARAAGFPGLAFIEETVAGPRAAPAATQPAAIGDPPALDDAFETLFHTLGERRSGQIEMARAIDGVLRDGGLLFVEAGTGTGKSLAYLVPAFLYHLASGNRVVVSTHTRNLQEQLLSREVQIACDAIGRRAPVARLMGRERYICARHVVSAVARLIDRPHDALSVALAAALAPEGIVDALAGLPRGVTPA
ncbi:MAG TPA: DEAD/DEAH box helicase, partial [Alphaproteobacteria bacterium]|nr:DEAD/DEAH box helicase [Alphaproteobacteria bacterium]